MEWWCNQLSMIIHRTIDCNNNTACTCSTNPCWKASAADWLSSGTCTRYKWLKYLHWIHCTAFTAILALILIIESLSGSASVQSQRVRSLYTDNGSLAALRPPNVIHFGNANMLILLKELATGSPSSSPSVSASVEARLNRDEDYFVPFNCPCGSSVASTMSCQAFECCVCKLRCPLSPTLNNSNYDSVEWANQFVRDNCPDSASSTSTATTFEDRLLYNGGFAKKFWSCKQPGYFPNRIHSTWFPYFCIHTDNLAYLGNYYEKHPKLGNIQKERFRWWSVRGRGLEEQYSWKHDKIQALRPQESATDDIMPTGAIVHELAVPQGNSSSRIKILGGSKCFRSQGLLRPDLSAFLPCGFRLNIDQSTNCEEIRSELDTAVEFLVETHLRSDQSNASYLAQGIQIKRALVNHTGIFTHESPAPGQRSMHCGNLTLGVEMVTTFYSGRPIGIRINYMKRDDQLVSPLYTRRLHITSTSSSVNKSLVSKYSRFWSNVLYSECPADYCWRDFFKSAKPAATGAEGGGLLLSYEAELFMVECFGILTILACLILHEFMSRDLNYRNL